MKEGQIVERGELPCVTCGEIHHARAKLYQGKRGEWMGRSWASPKDGHPYKTPSWESIARQIIEKYQVDLRKLADS